MAQLTTAMARLHEDVSTLLRAPPRAVVSTPGWVDASVRSSQDAATSPGGMAPAPAIESPLAAHSMHDSGVLMRGLGAVMPSPPQASVLAPLLDVVAALLRAQGVPPVPKPLTRDAVHVDDVCSVLLPYALQLYHVYRDWRQFVLLVSGTPTERCLAYDEKPLLVWQRMREAVPDAVLVLKEARDLESPLQSAQRKLRAKRVEWASGTKQEMMRMRAPPLSTPWHPGMRVATARGWLSHARGAESLAAAPMRGPAASLPRQTPTYAVAIYPYESARDDEFDVQVGDTFVVLSKTKGWWTLQRDSAADGRGDVWVLDAAHAHVELWSGWAPAGCLLETSRPLAEVATMPREPASALTEAHWRAEMLQAPLPPGTVVSVGSAGMLLYDYEAPDRSVRMYAGDRLRVFKRYQHWSYCLVDGARGARGWVPSWLVSRRPQLLTPQPRSLSAGEGMRRVSQAAHGVPVLSPPSTSQSHGP